MKHPFNCMGLLALPALAAAVRDDSAEQTVVVSTATIALQRHVGRAAHDSTQLKQVFSWLSIGPSISNFIGPFAAGVMIDFAGFRAAFALMALFPVISWLLVRGAPK